MNLEHSFFISDQNISGDRFVLDETESIHAIRVLRLKINEELFLFDGLGTAYKAKIDNLSYNKVEGAIIAKLKGHGENEYNINLGIGLIRRGRFENLIEKCTELGVNSFHPLLLDHNIKQTSNTNRCKKIVVASSKQCHRSTIPLIYEPKSLKSLFSLAKMKFIAASMEAKKKLSDVKLKGNRPIMLLIGPEGDFSSNEIELLKEKEVELFNLGNRRLRSETAAIAAVAILNYKFS